VAAINQRGIYWDKRLWKQDRRREEKESIMGKNWDKSNETHRREELCQMDTSSERWQLGNQVVEVSHLEKLYWPQTRITKGEMLGYYRQIAPVALPYFKDRPVTLRMFPEGVTGEAYYLRDCPTSAPDWLRRVPYRPKTATHLVPLPLIDTAAGMIWFANKGAIEFHLWSSHLPDLTQADQVIFDLDPGKITSFTDVREAALRLYDQLEREGIMGYPKTSGGHGLHIFVPLGTGYPFDRVRAWVKTMGQQLATIYPDLITIAHGPTHRSVRVTIDYAQNSVGRNTAAPYTLRANTASPTVSAPLTWEELAAGTIYPADLTPQVVLERIQRFGDLFAPLLSRDQSVPSLFRISEAQEKEQARGRGKKRKGGGE
jgi:bifunctional non-homologous end joining protein LigD